MSVRRAQMEIDSAEFSEWMAYAKIDPWCEERADYRTGIVASVIANLFRGKTQTPAKPTDFMPFREPAKIDRSHMVSREAMQAMLQSCIPRGSKR